MILDMNAVKAAFRGLVGFRSSANPDYPNPLPSLQQSDSGRYVSDVSSLLGIEAISQSSLNFDAFVFAPYDIATRDAGGYTQGSKVEFGGTNYEYASSTPSNPSTPDPDSDPQVWMAINDLSDYLLRAYDQGTQMLMDDWILAKKDRMVIKSIYEDLILFQGNPDLDDVQGNADDLVGIRIDSAMNERSLVLTLNSITVLFDAPVTNLPIYVYKAGLVDPIATFSVTQNLAKSTQTTLLSVNNQFRYTDLSAGATFFIGYKQSELEAQGAKAINYNLGYDSFRQHSRFIKFQGFEIEENKLSEGINVEDTRYTYSENYGLNFSLTCKPDLGAFIIREKALFGNALQYAIAMKILRDMSTSLRTGNQYAERTRELAMQQIMRHKEGVGTVGDQYYAALNGISFDLSGLADSALPCDDKRRYSISSENFGW